MEMNEGLTAQQVQLQATLQGPRPYQEQAAVVQNRPLARTFVEQELAAVWYDVLQQ